MAETTTLLVTTIIIGILFASRVSPDCRNCDLC